MRREQQGSKEVAFLVFSDHFHGLQAWGEAESIFREQVDVLP
jgi:hypothetical protein